MRRRPRPRRSRGCTSSSPRSAAPLPPKCIRRARPASTGSTACSASPTNISTRSLPRSQPISATARATRPISRKYSSWSRRCGTCAGTSAAGCGRGGSRRLLHLLPARSEIIRQPLGVIGVISPWNYPFQLGMLPAAAALAAGNRVLLKPSELTPRFSELLEKIVAATFAADEFAVVPGDVEVGRAFATLAVRSSVLHRLDGGRPSGCARRGAEPHAGDARARRQVARDHRRRLRLRRGRAANRVRQASQRRADLRRARLRAGAACTRRRVRDGTARRGREAVSRVRRESRLHEHRQRSPLSAPRGGSSRMRSHAVRRPFRSA